MSAIPLHSSPVPFGAASDMRGLIGASRMGYTPMPVQTEMWHLLDARHEDGMPLYENVVIEVPRRAGKTDGIFALVVGRCETTPDYQVTYAAQSGTKSRERFYGLLRAMRRHAPGGDWRARESRGEERFEWTNGSIFRFAPPKAENFRGDALDLAILDEAQETDDEDAADLLGSLMPVFDTRPDAQLIVAGTAGASRDGLLWEALEQGRAGNWGILEYALAEGLDPDDPANWLRTHPGPGGVSAARALEVLKKRHAQMDEEMFRREYLGVWPEFVVASAFDAALWASLAAPEPKQPRRYGLAFDCTPEGDRAAVTATWREGELVYAGLLDEREGTDWVVGYAAALAIRDRIPVHHDSTPFNNAVAAEIARRHPKAKVRALNTVEFASACALLATEVTNRMFRHSDQPDLNDAIAVASKRPITDGGWGWGRRKSSASIAPLVAISVGLKGFDMMPRERITRVISSKSA